MRGSSSVQSIGWPSRMNSRPPGRSSAATTWAQRRMSGSQQSAPIAGVHQVEPLPAERIRRVVDSDSTKSTSAPVASASRRRPRERGVGEVEPGHARAEPGERHGVGADVALQVDAVAARDVAEQRQVEADDVAQELRVVDELRDRVVGRGGVGGDALVPVRPVDLDRVSHPE